ncbi:GNAT family N-acetyltransferase [Paenibacillus chungangensis]|uniref:GNAT family N-acetyltransferase n=1 Tax=Paenibacillus chungangensis TaxID=696535 RepID=A0ABW3HXV7_9BACL
METQLWTPEEWRNGRQRLIMFASRFGEKRITAATLHAFRRLDGERLRADASGLSDTAVVTVQSGRRLIGLGFARQVDRSQAGEADDDEDASMIVIHPAARGVGAGSAILHALLSRLGRLTCYVATDNPASMALCFKFGMRAVSMHRGPTGKPTLRFEGGAPV